MAVSLSKSLPLLLVLLPLLLNLSSTHAAYTFPSTGAACRPLGAIPAPCRAPILSPYYYQASQYYYAPSIFSAGYAYNPYYQYGMGLAGAISPALYGCSAAPSVVSPSFSAQQQLLSQLQTGHWGFPYSYLASPAAYAYMSSPAACACSYLSSPAAYAYPYMSPPAPFAYPSASVGVC